MSRWRRHARVVIAVFAIAFGVYVARGYKRRAPVAPPVVVRTDPGAVVESTGGRVQRFTLSREDVRVEYEKQLTYADGTTKMMGVTVFADNRGGRNFTVTAREGHVASGESTIQMDGDVRLVASDGVTARTEHATYSDTDGVVRAPGPVEYANGRMTASGTGMTWDKNTDVLTILDQAVVRIARDQHNAVATDITSGGVVFARSDKYVRFERGTKMLRAGQIIEAATATAHLTADEKQIETVELREDSRITSSDVAVGGLQTLAGRDMDLKYRSDGETLEHALITDDAVIQLAGEPGSPGRQIVATTIDIGLAPDGSTPTALTGHGSVQLTLPAETGLPERTIRAGDMEATGVPDRGLTRAAFSNNVQYRERGTGIDRGANAITLEVTLKPGMSSIEDARFAHNVHFEDGKMTALSAAALYDLDHGTLGLTGSEPGFTRPRVVTDRIAVDATRIDVTLAGPKVVAAGDVKSVLQGVTAGADGTGDLRVPTILKQDQPVNVIAAALDYDGAISKASYAGGAQLWQGDTSIKGGTIMMDDRTGDMSAAGSVTTVTMMQELDTDKKIQRVRSLGTAEAFTYEDATRRATYTDSAHLSGPEGDMTAPKIELYMRPSGDEFDRMEAYESVGLRDHNRKIKGSRLTYTTDDERYVVTGTPVTVNDECDRETRGRTLIYNKIADTVVIDGSDQTRTQTRGGGKCQ